MSLLRWLSALLGPSFSIGDAADAKIVDDAKASAEWIAKALSSSGYKADFSMASLKEVDRFFEENAPGGNARPGGLLSEDVGARLFALGSYVGEVIRRAAGGQWKGDDNDAQAEITIEIRLKNGTVLWPVRKVMKRFQNGSEDGLYVYGVVATRP